ncbi:MAG: radical SAM protein [Candidatus Omnitrophica bacterium]|nr:radical SAM protein [Candidatus Omnitrophota bacterium]
MIKNYKIRELAFWDDNISLDKERFVEFCNLLNRFNLSWQTPKGIAISNLDENLIRLMKKSGYYRATFAIESGSREILSRYVDKPIDFRKAKEIIKFCNRLGIWTYGVFIIGFPDENISQIRETAKLSRSLGFDFIALFIAQPYPGTELYRIFKEKGLLPRNDYLSRSSMVYSQFSTIYFNHKQLWRIQQKIYLQFLLFKFFSFLKFRQWLYLYRKINNGEKLSYFLRLVKNIIGGHWFGRKL